MLKVPRTIPSRWTIRLGGGSSLAAVEGDSVDAVSVTAFVADRVSVGGVLVVWVSVVAAATAAASATILVSAGAVAIVPGASCFKYCAATKAYALVGGSISIQSPLVLSWLTVS